MQLGIFEPGFERDIAAGTCRCDILSDGGRASQWGYSVRSDRTYLSGSFLEAALHCCKTLWPRRKMGKSKQLRPSRSPFADRDRPELPTHSACRDVADIVASALVAGGTDNVGFLRTRVGVLADAPLLYPANRRPRVTRVRRASWH